MIEADKSQDLQGELAPWRPRRANGGMMVWFQSKGQEVYDPQRAIVSKDKKRSVSQFQGDQAEGILSDSGVGESGNGDDWGKV